MEKKMKLALLACAAVLSLPSVASAAEGDRVAADLRGNGITGSVLMTETGSGTVLVQIQAEGLPPGPHGFHVHEVGACDPSSGFKSAGGHLARGLEHGLTAEGGPHPGDFPNVHAQEDGVIEAEFFTRAFTLGTADVEANRRILDADGSAVMLHAGADDYSSQPAGDLGDRIACGVLQKVD